MVWLLIIAALVVGFLLGRWWSGFVVRHALRTNPDIVDQIHDKYGHSKFDADDYWPQTPEEAEQYVAHLKASMRSGKACGCASGGTCAPRTSAKSSFDPTVIFSDDRQRGIPSWRAR